jgi:hypothetical protein
MLRATGQLEAMTARSEARHPTAMSSASGAVSTTPELEALYRFWNDCQIADGIASRRRLTPFTLRPWLGYLCVYQLTDDDRDFTIKLDGTQVVELTGEDWTRRRVSEVDKRYGTTLLADCQQVRLSGLPAFSRPSVVFQKKWMLAFRLLLPVSSTGERYDQVFNAIYPADG